MAVIEKKPEKKKVDEQMVDRIVEETKQRKNLKEQIYDKINVPVWALDIVIVLLVAALAGRNATGLDRILTRVCNWVIVFFAVVAAFLFGYYAA